MATRQGYLWKRAGTSPPTMQRVFCVLAGSTLWDFDTEEEAALGLRPRCEIDLIGVSPWDGKARYQNYAFGFLFVSSLGTQYYAVAQSKEDLESWLSAMRVGLQAKLSSGSEPAADFKPPVRKDADFCGVSGQPLNRSNPKVFCTSCGAAFGQEYCSEDVPLLHFKQQTGLRVCRNCFLAQYFLNHLKLLNATLRTHLHELEQEGKPVTDKNSAKIRAFRNHSKEALLAWQLYDANQIDGQEFSELLLADARLKDERINTLLGDFQKEITQVGDDAVTLLRYLFDFRDEGQPLKYAKILQRLLDVAEGNLPAVDFVLPQLLQIFVLMSDRGLNQVLQLEALEEFIVRICTKSSAHIALRVVWSMMGYYEDTLQLNAPPFLLARRARIIRLTLHVEAAVKGNLRETNQEILHVFTIPSTAQLALIRHEWALLQACRQNYLLRSFPPMTPFRKMFGEIGDKEPPPRPGANSPSKAGGGGVSSSSPQAPSSPRSPSSRPPSMVLERFDFVTQMKFVKELTDTAESLRHIDISLRKETLRATLARIQSEYRNVFFPITRNYGPMPNVIRVCVDEGAVFRSKARVPVLICFEVLTPTSPPATTTEGAGAKALRRRRTSSVDYMSEEEVEHLIDKPAFHQKMNSLEEEGGKGGKEEEEEGALDDSTIVVDLTEEPSSARSAGSPRGGLANALSSGSIKEMVSVTTAGLSGLRHMGRGPLTPSSSGGGGGGEEGGARGGGPKQYASKDEVLKFVLHRRRRAGGLQRHRSNMRSGDVGSDGAASTPTRPVDDDAINLAKLIKQYEDSCSLQASQSQAQTSPGSTGGPQAAAAGMYISEAVTTAIEEFKKGNLSEGELSMLIENDRRFRQNIQDNSYLDVQFFVSMAFGESWSNKRARVKQASVDGEREGWDLVSMIVKSNDDLRQEVCTVQLIELCRDIFLDAGLELWLEPYGIISTTSSTGLIETLTDALSLDALKKKDGYVSLARHFELSYGHDATRLSNAKRSFITSLAAYSLVCYLLQIKDRHNGNILLDTEGHLIHIDYGFILGIAPGGSFSIETAPFKLTAEMVDVMGGTEAPLFDEFITLFACGFFALQVNLERIVAMIEIMAEQSRFPCFVASDKATIIQKIRARMHPGGRAPSSKGDTLAFALDLISQSYNAIGTRQYDQFQNWTNDVAI